MKKSVYYVIGGPYVSDQAGLNRGPLILIVFHCYFVSTFSDSDSDSDTLNHHVNSYKYITTCSYFVL